MPEIPVPKPITLAEVERVGKCKLPKTNRAVLLESINDSLNFIHSGSSWHGGYRASLKPRQRLIKTAISVAMNNVHMSVPGGPMRVYGKGVIGAVERQWYK
jgi:hypothetical protein